MITSYDYDQLPNRDSEFQLLKKRAQRRLDGFIPLLESKGMKNGLRFLDLACGHGIRTQVVAQHFPDSEVVGIDKSEEFLQFAKDNLSPQSNLKFLQGDANLLASEKPFDVVYSRLFFQHLSDPTSVLKNVFNVLKPGGKILIEDADRDFMKFSPAPPQWRQYWNSIGQAQIDRGGDPYMGTKIGSFLSEVGFKNVQVQLLPFVHDAKESRELIQDLLWNLNAYLEGDAREKGAEVLRELEVLSKKDTFRSFHILCVTSAER